MLPGVAVYLDFTEFMTIQDEYYYAIKFATAFLSGGLGQDDEKYLLTKPTFLGSVTGLLIFAVLDI